MVEMKCMYGRKIELERLNRLKASAKFEMLVMYGRRRVGKTTLLREFAGSDDKMMFFPIIFLDSGIAMSSQTKRIMRFWAIRPRLAREGALPFVPAKLEKWWGINPAIKAQDDVDILAIDKSGNEAMFCECKFRNKPMQMEEYEDLLTASYAFPHIEKKHFMFISKGGYTGAVKERAKRDKAILKGIGDLFEIKSQSRL